MAQLDVDILKEIPGYKAILKSVLKTQIQLLLEQLSNSTGEESIILTASIHDGSLSHLGSTTGKGFLEGRDEIKSQFLGYCLKTHHTPKPAETKSPYQRSNPGPKMPSHHPMKRSRMASPYARTSMSMSPAHSTVPKPVATMPNADPDPSPVPIDSVALSDRQDFVVKDEMTEAERPNGSESIGHNVGSEQDDYSSNPPSFPSSSELAHQSHSVPEPVLSDDSNSNKQTADDEALGDRVKLEPISEHDLDLEITGVDMGDNSMSADTWGQGQGQMGYASADSSLNTSGDPMAGYSGIWKDSTRETPGPPHLSWYGRKISEHATRDRKSDSLEPASPGYVSGAHVVSGDWPSVGALRSELKYGVDTPSTHEYVRYGFKFHTCDMCSKQCISRADLIRHIRIHTGEKPYQCGHCGRCFNHKSNMVKHMTTTCLKVKKSNFNDASSPDAQ